jgi:hypothetical protein
MKRLGGVLALVAAGLLGTAAPAASETARIALSCVLMGVLLVGCSVNLEEDFPDPQPLLSESGQFQGVGIGSTAAEVEASVFAIRPGAELVPRETPGLNVPVVVSGARRLEVDGRGAGQIDEVLVGYQAAFALRNDRVVAFVIAGTGSYASSAIRIGIPLSRVRALEPGIRCATRGWRGKAGTNRILIDGDPVRSISIVEPRSGTASNTDETP